MFEPWPERLPFRFDLGVSVQTDVLRFQNHLADFSAHCDLVVSSELCSLRKLHFTRLMLVGVPVVEILSPNLKVQCGYRPDSMESLRKRHRNFWSPGSPSIYTAAVSATGRIVYSTRCYPREVSLDHVQRLELECVGRSSVCRRCQEVGMQNPFWIFPFFAFCV